MKKLTLDIQMVVNSGTALIVKHPTGVFYEVQAGGLGCTHPNCQGFVIDLGSFGQDFSDCSYGCAMISDDENKQKELADALNTYFTNQSKNSEYKISFDFERIDELEEGWWPVNVSGKLNGGILANDSVEWEGYIHTGNCD